MKKYIFRCNLSLGDIVLLTGAIRDLHWHYPGLFVTDVRTSFRELWRYNPFLTPLNEYDPEVNIVECQDRLVNQSGQSACHALYGFLEFLNERLGFRLRPTAFRGDVYLSRAEQAGASPVRELTGKSFPYWLVVGGGKLDFTAKWWDPRRYQEVVDQFRGRIQFVQVGDLAHFHPRLRGVIDLRGRTTVRDLVRLVYHAQGVLCGVTGLMHLAAAVPAKDRRWPLRPCVVIAGGREPVHWEAYPGHQFIHTIGALPCCATDGCWKSRTVPLGDGDEKDRPEDLCRDVRDGLPHCMDLIASAEVARRISSYFEGGAACFLTAGESRRAAQAVALGATRPEPSAPLNIRTAWAEAERFAASVMGQPQNGVGRGIVICGGGVRLFTNAWVSTRLLRHLGCALPIQFWHLGRDELDGRMRELLRPLDVECVDGLALARKQGGGRWLGETLRSFALLNSPFQEVLLLDADNFAALNPEYLFETPEYRQTGAVLWPGLERLPRTDGAWRVFGVSYRNEPVAAGGQLLVNKAVCWRALALARWYDDNSDFYCGHVPASAETLRFALRKLSTPYAMPGHGPKTLRGAVCQHDFAGRVVFQQRNLAKWTLFPCNRRIAGFRHEELCRGFLRELGERWDGRCPRFGGVSGRKRPSAGIAAVMISCAEREHLRARTLRDLAQTDWGPAGVQVTLDERRFRYKVENISHTGWRALQAGLATGADYVLCLEDDLIFNRSLRRNLQCWGPLQEWRKPVLSLFNPGLPELAWDLARDAILVDGKRMFGSQAVLLSRAAIAHLLQHWFETPVQYDLKIGWLADALGQRVIYHCPSLVQHVGRKSTWGGTFADARDFRRFWRAKQV